MQSFLNMLIIYYITRILLQNDLTFVVVYQRVYQRVLSFLYNFCAHSQGEKFYLVDNLRGRNSIGEMQIPRGEDIFFLYENFVLFFNIMFVSCFLYGALSYVQYLCFVALIASCLCVGHVYILCYCVLLITCSDDHLLC